MVSMVFRAIKWIGIFASIPCLLLLQQKASSLTGISSLTGLVQQFASSKTINTHDLGTADISSSGNVNGGKSDGNNSGTGDIAQATSLLQSNPLVKQAIGNVLGNAQTSGISGLDLNDAPKTNTKATPTPQGSMTIMYHDDDPGDGQQGKLIVKTLPPGAKVIFYKGRPQIYYPPKD